MMKKFNFKTRRILLFVSFFVFLVSLTSCKTAGNPTGKLDVEKTYVKSGEYQVSVGELWDELRWNATAELTSKFDEVVISEHFDKVELVVDNAYSAAKEKGFEEDEATFTSLQTQYKERLTAYVIQDVYNFAFSTKSLEELADDIEDVKQYDEQKLFKTYVDEMYSTYNVSSINGKSIEDICKAKDYMTLATAFKNIYYKSLAKELLAYAHLEESITEAYDERDTEDADDIGYFTKSDYISKYKEDFTNQGDLNAILIRFSSEDEYKATLRSFGLVEYNKEFRYIPKTSETMNYAEYCEYYDGLTSADIKTKDALGLLDVLEVYIQMYNYVYGGYREMIYDTTHENKFNDVDLTSITAEIKEKNGQITTDYADEIKEIAKKLADAKSNDEDVVDTIYTRKDIDKISSSFNSYLYDTLTTPFGGDSKEDKTCYSTSTQSYNEGYWIAFKLEQGEDVYNIPTVNTTDETIYTSIIADADLKAKVETELKRDKITESLISEALKEAKEEIEVKIYDEAIEISYSVQAEGYSKTYGKAPNENVAAVIKYNDKEYNVNIVEDTTDENAVSGGLYDALEVQYGVTTAIDILSKKVVKDTQAWKDTAEDIKVFEDNLKYLLVAFTNNYYSSNGYPSSIGKYNFMMLYFHTANVDDIIDNFYRVNAASSSILTDYTSDKLINFFDGYSKEIYNNYFSIGGKRLVVYVDANDDNVYDDVEVWSTKKVTIEGEETTIGDLAAQLVLDILNEVESLTGSHATALTNLVSEINTTARAKYDANPIAPENKWSQYRKYGLNVALEDVSATNSTTDIDFALKERLYNIYKSEGYHVNETIPTEYLEELSEKDDILVTEDGYNLLLITSADFTTSAKFTKEDDTMGVFESVSVYYNEEYVTITDLYNENDELSLSQIKLYVLEYVTTSSSNLSASQISSSLSNFLSPVLSRFTATETQRDILIYFIESQGENCEIDFVTDEQNARFDKIVEINHNTVDGYLDIYNYNETTNPTGDKTDTLNTYADWWKEVKNIVKEILPEGDK